MGDEPLVSLVLIAYNQERFIREAVQSAFKQDYRNLEIVLSDDCSSDRTFDLMEEEARRYGGGHSVVLNRNPRNLGVAEHLNRVWGISRGDFIVQMAGDDVSLPGRTSVLVSRWRSINAPVDLVGSYFEEIDEFGEPTGTIREDVAFLPDTRLPVSQWRCGATGACIGYDRKVVQKFGVLDRRVVAEDWVLPFRAWLGAGVAIVEEPLVRHRSHPGSLSVESRRVGREDDAVERLRLRRRAAGDRYGRALNWRSAWESSGRGLSDRLERDFGNWIALCRMEFLAYERSRISCLGMCLRALARRRGLRSALRMLVRNVVRI